MTAEVLALARSEALKKYEFCLLSADGSLSELAARLRWEMGDVVATEACRLPKNDNYYIPRCKREVDPPLLVCCSFDHISPESVLG